MLELAIVTQSNFKCIYVKQPWNNGDSNPSVNESVLPVSTIDLQMGKESHDNEKCQVFSLSLSLSVEVNLLGIPGKLRVLRDWGANVGSLVLWFRV